MGKSEQGKQGDKWIENVGGLSCPWGREANAQRYSNIVCLMAVHGHIGDQAHTATTPQQRRLP